MNFLAQIEHSPKRINLVESLRQQLAKDLSIDPSEVPVKELEQWLESWLDDHLKSIDIAHLLYRIDLAEKAYADSKSLAIAILEREAQKVIFRAQYSGKL